MPLCNEHFRCTPNNYALSARESTMTEKEQFVMLPVKNDVFNFKSQCTYFYHIDEWMEWKVQQYKAQQAKAASSLKTQTTQ